MSYPFAQAPTLREFLDVALAHGATVGISKSTIVGPDGESRFRYVQKSKGSAPIILTFDDEDRLTPFMLSNLCRKLGIDPSVFSMGLGGLSEN